MTMNRPQAKEWVVARSVTDEEYRLLQEVIYGKVCYIDGVLSRQPQCRAAPRPCCESDYEMLGRLIGQRLIELSPRYRHGHDSSMVWRATDDGELYHILRRALNTERAIWL